MFKGVVKGGAAAAGSGGGSAGCRVDAAYFDSYSYFDIHQEMLSDKVWGGVEGRGGVKVQCRSGQHERAHHTGQAGDFE